ncbi:hypothetical protein RRG08_012352 [Elysia crispata]|uniref:Uncharacterized protein n=1 Tax=Elysia crispata TaxID=231223 RepID=A0AAE1DXA1_9GAST|nr:hypothetical protein RRG08_012352 [Elysia crispata]
MSRDECVDDSRGRVEHTPWLCCREHHVQQTDRVCRASRTFPQSRHSGCTAWGRAAHLYSSLTELSRTPGRAGQPTETLSMAGCPMVLKPNHVISLQMKQLVTNRAYPKIHRLFYNWCQHKL